MHLFCGCYVIYDSWEEVILWLNHLFRRDTNLTNFNNLFGFLIGNYLKLLNFVWLNARFLIRSCKFSKRKPNLKTECIAFQCRL